MTSKSKRMDWKMCLVLSTALMCQPDKIPPRVPRPEEETESEDEDETDRSEDDESDDENDAPERPVPQRLLDLMARHAELVAEVEEQNRQIEIMEAESRKVQQDLEAQERVVKMLRERREKREKAEKKVTDKPPKPPPSPPPPPASTN